MKEIEEIEKDIELVKGLKRTETYDEKFRLLYFICSICVDTENIDINYFEYDECIPFLCRYLSFNEIRCLFLYYFDKTPKRKISRILGIHISTVREYIRIMKYKLINGFKHFKMTREYKEDKNTPIRIMNFFYLISSRTLNTIISITGRGGAAEGTGDIKELTKVSEQDLLGIKGCGLETVKEIKSILHKFDLTLSTEGEN